MSNDQSGPRQLFYSNFQSSTINSQPHYIFFITGNPGLIAYYEPFLSCLASLLNSSLAQFFILGTSLAGFEDSALSSHRHGAPLYGLQRQIQLAEERIHEFIRLWHDQATGAAKVILIGHSVGAYIAMELISRRRAARKGIPSMSILGGVLLFPTVTHIAKSPSGIKLSRLLRVPYFPLLVGLVASTLTCLIPRAILSELIRYVLGFPEHAARTTAQFIKSKTAVTQALYMAKDEMQMITEDSWDDAVWGAAEASEGIPADPPLNLIFYFGKKLPLHPTKDHWVADHTRDELIAARGRSALERGSVESGWKPLMLVDESNIPHGFCINHSEIMAEKVKTFLEEVVERSKNLES